MRTMRFVRALPGFVRSLYRARRGLPDLPRFLTFTTNFSCNARCSMCDSWKLPDPNRLHVDEIKKIFRQLPQMDLVRITGGEPTSHPDFSDIVRYAQEILDPLAGIHVTTNGFLTNRIVQFCEERPKTHRLELLVSVDKVGVKHSEVRGVSKAWEWVVNTIEALAPRQDELRMKLAVNQTVVDEEGARHYRELHELAKKWGVFHKMVVAYGTSATYNQSRGLDLAPRTAGEFVTFGQFERSTLEQLFLEAEQDLESRNLLERLAGRYYLSGIRRRLLDGIGDPNPTCVALGAHLRIYPNGDVPTCQFNGEIVGNLARQSFQEVWNGVVAAEQRKKVRSCPGCWAECEVLPSAVYTGDLLTAFNQRSR